MVGKMILSSLPGGGYVQLREGYSSLDVLAAVCGAVLEKNTNSNNSSSSSSSFPKSVFIPRRKRSRPNRSTTTHEVFMAADSVLKCGVKRVSIGGGPAGNQKKRAAKKMKKRVIADENQQPAAAEAGPMPERFRGRIRQLAGPGAEIAEEMLLIEKEITGTDLNPKESRLSLPLKQLRRTDFLTAEEKERLLTRHNNGINVGSVDVALIAAVNGEIIIKRELHLRRWEMRKDRGKTSVSLMVTKEWNKIKGSLGLAVGTKVQIWSVRVDGELWLSLVVL
ncbi:unnamed protein product [Cuscuta epithymum]|uniref:B3 domain-containing protein n=1 Tax=Cuscuta epithymum TaxID=186058 RepID=A0AAV0DQT0_9ASTE|nr:unnamed protein product [Cuscuta epithymum]